MAVDAAEEETLEEIMSEFPVDEDETLEDDSSTSDDDDGDDDDPFTDWPYSFACASCKIRNKSQNLYWFYRWRIKKWEGHCKDCTTCLRGRGTYVHTQRIGILTCSTYINTLSHIEVCCERYVLNNTCIHMCFVCVL